MTTVSINTDKKLSAASIAAITSILSDILATKDVSVHYIHTSIEDDAKLADSISAINRKIYTDEIKRIIKES